MLIPLGLTVQLKTKYIKKRGSIYQFELRVPADLAARYSYPLIRKSLRTSDKLEAIRKAEPLKRYYDQEFQRLRENDSLAPKKIGMTAKELAHAVGSMENFITHVMEPKFHQKIGRYIQELGTESPYGEPPHDPFNGTQPEQYLSPTELEAAKLLKEGLDTLRLSDALRLYLETHTKAGDQSFIKGVSRQWERLTSHLGDIPISSHTRDHARSFRDHLLKQGLKTTTVRRNLKQINAILNAAIREASLNIPNHFSELKIAREGTDAKETRVPTQENLKDIVTTLRVKNTKGALLSLLLVETGARIGEFSGMKVSDVFLDAPIPYVRIKANEWRDVKTDSSNREFPLVGVSLETMKKVLELPRKSEALFDNYAKPRGQDAASSTANKTLEQWEITSHGFRHALKDRLREAGCPKDIRDAIQGHENGEVAESYGLGHTLKTMQNWLEKIQISLCDQPHL